MAKKLREIVVAVTADTAAYQREMNRVSRTGSDYFKTVEQGAKRADAAYQRNAASIRMQVTAVDEATRSVAAYAHAVAAAFSVGKLTSYADSWTNLNNRLKLVTEETSEFQAAQNAVYSIAQNSRAPLQATAELYQRIATNQDALGLSGQGVASIVDTISKTMAISGASTQAADAALVQLGQAFASGTLRGEELNSVMEQAPALAKAIAEGLGVPIGELRALGATGQLTAQQVVSALQKMAGGVDTQFAKIRVTVGQSLTVLENSIMAWVGRTDEAAGASRTLSEGILALSRNFDSAAIVAAGAALGALGGKLGQVSVQAFQATQAFMANRVELINQARAQMLAAQAGLRKAQTDVFLAEKEALAARGTAVQTQLAIQLAQARVVERGATEGAAAATARYAAVSNTAAAAGRAVLGFLGGPVGLAITVASVAAGWLLFRDNTDSATQALLRMKGSADEVIGKFRELNQVQQEVVVKDLERQIEAARRTLTDGFRALENAPLKLRVSPDFAGFREQVAELAEANLPFADLQSRLFGLVDGFAKTVPNSRAARSAMMEVVSTTLEAARQVDDLKARLGAFNDEQGKVASSAKVMGAAVTSAIGGMAAADWAKYMQNLVTARDVIGLTVQEAGAYRARAEGANAAQAALAGALVAQADAAQKLQKATEDKDEKAIAGAKATLRSLIEVEAQQRGIIAAAQEAIRLQAALAKGQLDPSEFNRFVAEAGRVAREQALADAAQRTDSQIRNISANTPVGKAGAKAGDDWAKWVRERQAEVAGQLALADAYRAGTQEVERATIAKQAEAEVLKYGAANRAQIVSLLQEEAQARLAADASKQIADMGKEIALIDAKTEAERILWETQSGAYASLDENIKKALVGRARELDLTRKQAEYRSYIGQVSGRAEADEMLEKMGMLAQAYETGAINFQQMQAEIGKLTGEGADDLTQFAIQGARNIQSYLGDALFDAVSGKFDDIGRSFLELLARMASQAAAANIGKALFGDFGSGGNGLGGFFGAAVSAITSWAGGGVADSSSNSVTMPTGGIKFAKGGVVDSPSLSAYSGGIYDSPQFFAFAKGGGVFGEAGPEAIMPLERGSDGSLGVRVSFPDGPQGEVQGLAGGIQVNVYVQGDGGVNTETQGAPEEFGRGMGEVIRGYVQQELARSFRVGGMNWKARNQQLGGAY